MKQNAFTYSFVIMISAILCLASCNNNSSKSTTESTDKKTEVHNAQNSLDWAGTYSNDTLKISLDENMIYTRKSPSINESGEFAWDTEGYIIALVDSKGELSLLKVEENRLTNGADLVLIKE